MSEEKINGKDIAATMQYIFKMRNYGVLHTAA